MTIGSKSWRSIKSALEPGIDGNQLSLKVTAQLWCSSFFLQHILLQRAVRQSPALKPLLSKIKGKGNKREEHTHQPRLRCTWERNLCYSFSVQEYLNGKIFPCCTQGEVSFPRAGRGQFPKRKGRSYCWRDNSSGSWGVLGRAKERSCFLIAFWKSFLWSLSNAMGAGVLIVKLLLKP